MPDHEYHVVPFLGDVNSRDKNSANRVARQLQDVIDANIGSGGEFFRIDQVQILMRPGCLGSLFGAKEATVGLDMVTFRRART